MPPKYHIPTQPVENRYMPVRRSGVIAWEEGCLRCVECVKKKCVMGVYEKRSLDPVQMMDTLDYLCLDCFRCVQSCPGRLIHKSLNPHYLSVGDDYWTAELIESIWYQASTGRIPVSGAGYGGPFSGDGFDSMWTDMSEIVRPTRDGIHGREYISTTVDVGRKPPYLRLGPGGELMEPPPPILEVPLPVMFRMPPWSPSGLCIHEAILWGAKELGTYALLDEETIHRIPAGLRERALPVISGCSGRQDVHELLGLSPLVEITYSDRVVQLWQNIKERHPGTIVSIRVPFEGDVAGRCSRLAHLGVEVIHLYADPHGREWGEKGSRFIKDGIRDVHDRLVKEGVRDEVTIVAGGGIAAAEHMAKAVICGADLVTVDIALLVAMECRVCGRCSRGLECPVELENVDPRWGGLRIRNLMAGWHNQLLEIMGAMGMRDVRRLRGEMGRAMFFEDLERDFVGLLGPKAKGDVRGG